MLEISANDIDIIADRLMLFSEVRLSHSRALQALHQAKWEVSFRHILEQIAEGGRSNADFAAWAKKALADQKADRPKVRTKSRPLVSVAAV